MLPGEKSKTKQTKNQQLQMKKQTKREWEKESKERTLPPSPLHKFQPWPGLVKLNEQILVVLGFLQPLLHASRHRGQQFPLPSTSTQWRQLVGITHQVLIPLLALLGAPRQYFLILWTTNLQTENKSVFFCYKCLYAFLRVGWWCVEVGVGLQGRGEVRDRREREGEQKDHERKERDG